MDIKESKVEVLKRHRANLARRHEEELADFDEAFEMVRAELAEPEKPKLRHGGTGKDRTGNFVLIDEDALWKKVYKKGTGITSTAINKNGDTRVLTEWANQLTGNIFADLTALSEDVEEFEVACRCIPKDTLSIAVCGGCPVPDIHFSIKGRPGSVHVPITDLPKLILKLRQMAATAKRKAEQ